MTVLAWTGYRPLRRTTLPVPRRIAPAAISVVVPVRNNAPGLARLLHGFAVHASTIGCMPAEIIVVDNHSTPPVTLSARYPFPVSVVVCERLGPAAARNTGAERATGDWILFIDSDCRPTRTTLCGYATERNENVAYAGWVSAQGAGCLAEYYASQSTLNPPAVREGGTSRPEYLVTANCLVSTTAFNAVGCFDQRFTHAGGEDIELAFRLLEAGDLGFCRSSTVLHVFDDGLSGFFRRFVRYGRGNRALSEKYRIDLAPRPFAPVTRAPCHWALALLQLCAMRVGYLAASPRIGSASARDAQ
jgi:glycosyltransferase involved in cell wall biosynthesis